MLLWSAASIFYLSGPSWLICTYGTFNFKLLCRLNNYNCTDGCDHTSEYGGDHKKKLKMEKEISTMNPISAFWLSYLCGAGLFSFQSKQEDCCERSKQNALNWPSCRVPGDSAVVLPTDVYGPRETDRFGYTAACRMGRANVSSKRL